MCGHPHIGGAVWAVATTRSWFVTAPQRDRLGLTPGPIGSAAARAYVAAPRSSGGSHVRSAHHPRDRRCRSSASPVRRAGANAPRRDRALVRRRRRTAPVPLRLTTRRSDSVRRGWNPRPPASTARSARPCRPAARRRGHLAGLSGSGFHPTPRTMKNSTRATRPSGLLGVASGLADRDGRGCGTAARAAPAPGSPNDRASRGPLRERRRRGACVGRGFRSVHERTRNAALTRCPGARDHAQLRRSRCPRGTGGCRNLPMDAVGCRNRIPRREQGLWLCALARERLPDCHGKEGVAGSSPAEGFTNRAAARFSCFRSGSRDHFLSQERVTAPTRSGTLGRLRIANSPRSLTCGRLEVPTRYTSGPDIGLG
jgi:hypothetical protein